MLGKGNGGKAREGEGRKGEKEEARRERLFLFSPRSVYPQGEGL